MLKLHFPILDEDQMRQRSRDFLEVAQRRRSLREFSDRPVPREIIEQCLLAAGTAPSGANTQPWYFAVVESPDIKRQIRVAAEKEEQAFYAHKAPQYWLDALAPLGTDADKPFLETAPYLIAVFQQRYGEAVDGSRVKHYYAPESVGIATGILVTALHHAGLACLTHTPSPMGFLNQILGRPKAERPFVLLVVGFPAIDAKVPDIQKKTLAEIASFL